MYLQVCVWIQNCSGRWGMKSSAYCTALQYGPDQTINVEAAERHNEWWRDGEERRRNATVTGLHDSCNVICLISSPHASPHPRLGSRGLLPVLAKMAIKMSSSIPKHGQYAFSASSARYSGLQIVWRFVQVVIVTVNVRLIYCGALIDRSYSRWGRRPLIMLKLTLYRGLTWFISYLIK